MSVTGVHKDPEALTMTLTAEYAAPMEQVWDLWADPRKLERWWGPPAYPATFVDHDLSPGGHVSYFMTGPEGDKPHGWWRVLSVDPPKHLEFENGFADDAGQPDPAMPSMTMLVRIEELGGRVTRMTIRTTFPSMEAMDQLISMGMEEGMTAAVGQTDDLLQS
jgi:uncharacterized protein YndB with AHSA1/START domain